MHLLMVLGVALLVFGPRKLPELGKGLGEAIRGFKKGMQHEEDPKPTASAADLPDASKRDSAS